MESGAATARAVYSYNHPLHERQFKEFIAKLGAQDVPEDKLMGYLRRQNVDLVKKASEAIFENYNPSVRWPFQPVHGDGEMIPIRPIVSPHLLTESTYIK